MMKTLRYSLLSLFALMCGNLFAESTVKFDFDNEYATLFPTLAGTSSNDSHDGDFTAATTATVDGVKLTVSAANEGVTNANRIWSGSPRLRMYSGTLTIEAPEGHKITAIDVTLGKWNANNTADKGKLDTSTGKWTGEEQSVVITISANTQLKDLTVTLDGTATDTPDEPKTTIEFTKATSVESGKNYLIVFNVEGTLKAATQITSNYGYINTKEVQDENGSINITDEALIYTITAVDGGYSIQQNDGRYVYQSGTYNNFNVNETAKEAYVWSIEPTDGAFTIKNVEKEKYMQYDTKYSNIAAYANASDNLPLLYVKKDSTPTAIESVKAEQNDGAIYNLQGQRVVKAVKGLYIINGKKVLVK